LLDRRELVVLEGAQALHGDRHHVGDSQQSENATELPHLQVVATPHTACSCAHPVVDARVP
jgi:hypothetical protein